MESSLLFKNNNDKNKQTKLNNMQKMIGCYLENQLEQNGGKKTTRTE